MNEKLQQLVDLLPLISELYDKDVYLSVFDTDSTILGFSVPKGEQPLFSIGEKFIDPSGALDEVLKTGRKKHNYLSSDVMGAPFEGEIVPIKEGITVIGAILSTYKAGKKASGAGDVSKFKESVNSINHSVEEIVNGIATLSSDLTAVNGKVGGMGNDVKEAVGVVNQISGNASRSNILALNASIEAARSGDAGRGFAVVANEMSKLAKDSGDSANQIKVRLNAITGQLDEVTQSVQESSELAQKYISAIEDIKVLLQQVTALAEDL